MAQVKITKRFEFNSEAIGELSVEDRDINVQMNAGITLTPYRLGRVIDELHELIDFLNKEKLEWEEQSKPKRGLNIQMNDVSTINNEKDDVSF